MFWVGENVTVTSCELPALIVPLLQSPEKPSGYEMEETERLLFPSLEMVNVFVEVVLISTSPKSRLPVREIMLPVPAPVPVPLTAKVFAPLVASEITSMLPE